MKKLLKSPANQRDAGPAAAMPSSRSANGATRTLEPSLRRRLTGAHDGSPRARDPEQR
jgi:hypothetical protein